MGAVLPPDITYRPHLPLEVVTEGKLSSVQLERVIYAGQRHEQRLAEGERGGVYVGDGNSELAKAGYLLESSLIIGVRTDAAPFGYRSIMTCSESTRRDLNDLGVPIPLAPD